MSAQYIHRNPNFKDVKGVYKIYCFFDGKTGDARFINITQKRIGDEWRRYHRSNMVNGVNIIHKELYDWWHSVRAATGDHLFIKQIDEATNIEDATNKLKGIQTLYKKDGISIINPDPKISNFRSPGDFAHMNAAEKTKYIKLGNEMVGLISSQKAGGIHQLKIIRMLSKIYGLMETTNMLRELTEGGLIKKFTLSDNGRPREAWVHKDHWKGIKLHKQND